MTLASDLLAQAKHLVSRERGRPRQASLRRAASVAYYALFHLLIREASQRLVPGPAIQKLVARVYTHIEMSKASRSFSGGTLPQKFVGITGSQPLPLALRNVANAFVELQQARHEADYNVAKSFSRAEVQSLIDQAEQAFQDWQAVRRTTAGRLYLVCLLLWERLDKIK